MNATKPPEAKERTSEDYHGISPQPPPTCPIIDKTLKWIGQADLYIRRWERDKDDAEALSSRLDNIENAMSGVEDKLEEIRQANDAIRSWGQEWKEYALELAKKAEL